MGSSNYSSQAANFLRSSSSTKSTKQLFTQNVVGKIAATMDPKGLKFRESRDSAAHPMSVPIMFMLDVTGSMGSIPEYLVKNSLPTLMEVIIKHGVAHPQILFGAIGDSRDDAPVQVGQFESGAEELNKCITSAWLEGNGHGNGYEAYSLAWLVAARHTSLDSFEKRGQKGILITVGDEKYEDVISAGMLKHLMGYTEAKDLSAADILAEAQRSFDVFHIHANEGNYPNDPNVFGQWKKLLNERFIVMEDMTKLAEIVGTTVAMLHGADLDTVTAGFDPNTAQAVGKALAVVSQSITSQRGNTNTGVINL